MKEHHVQNTPCAKAKDYLEELIERLDELDEVDYFGSEGWREMLMQESE